MSLMAVEYCQQAFSNGKCASSSVRFPCFMLVMIRPDFVEWRLLERRVGFTIVSSDVNRGIVSGERHITTV
jgi:hypothetical protein